MRSPECGGVGGAAEKCQVPVCLKVESGASPSDWMWVSEEGSHGWAYEFGPEQLTGWSFHFQKWGDCFGRSKFCMFVGLVVVSDLFLTCRREMHRRWPRDSDH